MSFMRLGTRVAVINEKNEILLSKRGDFGTWALPGGRVDSGELIQDCAIREVFEETGLEVKIERAVGLYYQQGRSRTNILYRAKPVGGELFDKTDETLENRFFARDNLPETPFGKFYIDDAYTSKTVIRTIETPRLELLKLDLQLRWRWLKNWLSGRPEPKFPQFVINSVAIVSDSTKNRFILNERELIRYPCTGEVSLHHLFTLFPFENGWKWVGLFQDTHSDTIEFVFEVITNKWETRWKVKEHLADSRDRRYVELSAKKRKGIWLLTQEDFKHEW